MRFKKADYVPTDRWQVLETCGVPLMTSRLAVPMTVNADTYDFIVPKGERWVIFDAMLQNVSGQTIACYCWVYGSGGANDPIGLLCSSGTLATGTFINSYNAGSSAYLATPLILYEGQRVRFVFGALAGKSGNSYVYLNALQFDVGKGV